MERLPERMEQTEEVEQSPKLGQSAVSVLIVAELVRGCRWSRTLHPNICIGRDFNPEPLDGHSSTLTTRPPCTSDKSRQKSIP